MPRATSAASCATSRARSRLDGTTRAVVTELMREMPYRLLGTATAAPNDYLELGTSSEALGELGYTDMLTRFFVNDQRTASSRSNFCRVGSIGGLAIQGHAQEPFWRWVASWARDPSPLRLWIRRRRVCPARPGRARARRGRLATGLRGRLFGRVGGRPVRRARGDPDVTCPPNVARKRARSWSDATKYRWSACNLNSEGRRGTPYDAVHLVKGSRRLPGRPLNGSPASVA